MTGRQRRARARQLHEAAWPDLFANLHTAYGELARAQFELQNRAAELEEASGLFQRVVESLSDALLVTDSSGRVLQTNPSATRLLDREPAEIVGKTLLELTNTTDLPTTPWDVLKRDPSGLVSDLEHEISTPAGRRVFISASCGLLRDRRGKITGTLVVMRDVTERRRAAIAQAFLAQASKVLTSLDARRTLHNLAALIVPDLAEWCGIELIEPDGTVRPVAAIHVDPVKTRLVHELQQRHPLGPRSWEPVRRVLALQRPVLVPRLSDEPGRDAALTRLLCETGLESALIVPLLARQRVVGVLTLARSGAARRYDEVDLRVVEDLGARAALAVDNMWLFEAEQQARAESDKAVRVRDEFLSIAAHELKTPMTSLLGAAQITIRQLERGQLIDPDRLRARLAVIDQQTNRLARLVAQLLDVSQIESGKLALRRELTDLRSLVERVVHVAALGTAAHTFVLSAPNTLWLSIDPLRFEQVISNLIDNAVKYSPSGGQIDVTVDVVEAALARVSVRDRGVGVPVEHRGRLFDRFYQAHAGEFFAGRTGMGLGLYISRDIVELHGGHINVEFPPDGGTRFEVVIPGIVSEPASVTAAPEQHDERSQ